MRWPVTASRRSSTRTRARSSPAPPSPEHSSTTALRSAWMARVLGGTMCSSSDCGAASSTRRSICGPTTASPTPVIRLAVIWTSTTAGAHTRALTAPRPIRPTSRCCPSARQPNPGRAPLIDAENLFRQSGPPQVDLFVNLVVSLSIRFLCRLFCRFLCSLVGLFFGGFDEVFVYVIIHHGCLFLRTPCEGRTAHECGESDSTEDCHEVQRKWAWFEAKRSSS